MPDVQEYIMQYEAIYKLLTIKLLPEYKAQAAAAILREVRTDLRGKAIGEAKLRKKQPYTPDKDENEMATLAQKKFLLKLKVEFNEKTTKAEASDLIEAALAKRDKTA